MRGIGFEGRSHHWQRSKHHDTINVTTGPLPLQRSHLWKLSLEAAMGKGKLVLDDRGLEHLDPFGDEAPARSNRTRFLVISAVIVLALGYMIYAAFPGNALYFLTVSEFNSKSEVQDGRVLRVSGRLVEGTFGREANPIDSQFQITDKDGDTPGTTLQASYTGVLPFLQSPLGVDLGRQLRR